MKINKKYLTSIIALGFVGLTLTGCSNNSNVAIMHHGKVTVQDVYDNYKSTKEGQDAIAQQVIYKALDTLYGNKVTTQDVNKSYDQMVAEYGKSNFEKQLATSNMTPAQYKNNLRNNLLLQQQGISEYKVTSKDKKLIKKGTKPKIASSHILVKSKKEANDIIEKLNKGQNFGKLAKKYSTDTATAKQNGKLTPFVQGETTFVKPFQSALNSLKQGEYTKKPVKTQFGYHIIMRDKNTKGTSYDKAKEDYIKKQVTINMQKQSNVTKMLKDAIAKADLNVKDNDIKKAVNAIVNAKPEKSQNASQGQSQPAQGQAEQGQSTQGDQVQGQAEQGQQSTNNVTQ